jgi:prephenate dehydrogenase
LLSQSTGWQEIAPLAASGFRDATRLASGEPQMSYDIAVTNREAILGWLDRYQAELASLREAIAAADPDLLERFARIKLKRDTFVESPPAARPDARSAATLPRDELEQSLIALLAGRSAADRLSRNPDQQRS